MKEVIHKTYHDNDVLIQIIKEVLSDESFAWSVDLVPEPPAEKIRMNCEDFDGAKKLALAIRYGAINIFCA